MGSFFSVIKVPISGFFTPVAAADYESKLCWVLLAVAADCILAVLHFKFLMERASPACLLKLISILCFSPWRCSFVLRSLISWSRSSSISADDFRLMSFWSLKWSGYKKELSYFYSLKSLPSDIESSAWPLVAISLREASDSKPNSTRLKSACFSYFETENRSRFSLAVVGRLPVLKVSFCILFLDKIL